VCNPIRTLTGRTVRQDSLSMSRWASTAQATAADAV
jgi:hypothetical protein